MFNVSLPSTEMRSMGGHAHPYNSLLNKTSILSEGERDGVMEGRLHPSCDVQPMAVDVGSRGIFQ